MVTALERREQLRAALAAARARVRAAERAAGRPEGGVELVVVTKTFPAGDVRLLAGLGVDQVGESREPEAGQKVAACADLPLRWHQVGQVQTNKAAAVASWADVVHSVDRARLVTALSRGAVAAGRTLRCLLQVRLDDAGGAGGADSTAGAAGTGRGGAAPGELAALAEAVEGAEGLVLAGVMGLAPLGADPLEAFGALADASSALVARHPAATTVSAGMSGDVEAAVARGATLVRLGSAVLGTRPPMH